jgi:pyruvate/2-oxoglutarate dehydrogenase complex dihydrolipoamide dehydrogenase (E3) component
MKAYDVVVVGGGSAGYAAARTAAAGGARTAVIEGGAEVGGLCILRGCMPTKALLESAHRAQAIREAGEFGLRVGPVRADWNKIIARKDALIADFADYRAGQLTCGPFDFIRARATFSGPHTLALHPVPGVKTRIPAQIEGRTFIIATGSVLERKPIPGLWEAGCLTSDTAIHARRPFKDLIVLGGGAIACEFAQYFLNLGVRVTLIQRSGQLLTGQDADAAAALEAAFRREGMRVITGTTLERVSVAGGRKTVHFRQGGKARRVVAAEILYALGRVPATASLGLESAGVRMEGRAPRINASLQTSARHIFAVGDVAGPYEVVHTAIAQGEMAARNALRLLDCSKALERMDYSLHMEVVFTQPEVASIGLSEKEAAARGVEVRTASYPFNDHGKSMIMGAKEGFVKIIARPGDGRILGAQVVGPHASDLIHEFAAVMHFKGTVRDLAAMPHYHPTLAEIVTYPAEELAG